MVFALLLRYRPKHRRAAGEDKEPSLVGDPPHLTCLVAPH